MGLFRFREVAKFPFSELLTCLEVMRNNLAGLTTWLWSDDIQYLLEVCLRLKKNSEASELIRI